MAERTGADAETLSENGNGPRERAPEVSGVLNLDKPAGLSSHDAVNRVRRIANQRRIGHSGTLDPTATGVLVLCLGQATRVAEYVADAHKIYRARVRMGITTSTWDSEGEVTAEADASGLSLSDIEAALTAFRGDILQVPPMFSAIKREGKPLYKLARRGLNVEREARRVTVYALDLEEWRPPDLVVRVTCSKGTYIRALAHDLGEALGTGAHLAALRRLAVGAFTAEEAVSLDTLYDAEADGAWRRYLQPVGHAVRHMPSVTVDGPAETRLRNGQSVMVTGDPDRGLHCAFSEAGELVAILRYDTALAAWQPAKVLPAQAL